MKELGEYLKETRENNCVGIEEASEDLNVSVNILENIENGNTRAFRDMYDLKEKVKEYAKYLGLNPEEVIDEFNDLIEFLKEIGYNKEDLGFYYKTCNITKFIFEQSPDISQGVTEGQGLFKEMGAGDQGLMFGYASNEAMNYDAEYMPLGIFLAHKLINRHKEIRKSDKNTFLVELLDETVNGDVA